MSTIIRLKVWANDDRGKSATVGIDKGWDFRILLEKLSEKLQWNRKDGQKLFFLDDGAAIDDISLLRDDDKVVLSRGEPFIQVEDSGGSGPIARSLDVSVNPAEAITAIYKKTAELLDSSGALRALCENPQQVLVEKYFLLPEKHPFFSPVQRAQIPVRPNGTPDLLKFQLPTQISAELTAFLERKRKIDEVDEVHIDEDPMEDETKDLENSGVHTAAAEVLRKAAYIARDSNAANALVLMGPSGCAKTRTCYEILCCRLGLYFTASKGKNGGSFDVQKMINDLELRLPSCESIEIREEIGNRHVLALLLSRLIVLDYLRKKLKDFTPFFWMKVQIEAPLLLSDNKEELFLVLYNFLKEQPSFLLDKWIEILIKSEASSLIIVMDEAQVLTSKCLDQFRSLTNSTNRRSLFYKVVNRWTVYPRATLVISGTGLRLQDALRVVASAVLKDITTMPHDQVIVDFGGYYSYPIWKKYVTQFFGDVSDGVLREIFAFLKGRYRYTSYFVSLTLTSRLALPKPGDLLNAVLVNMKQYVVGKVNDTDENSPRYPLASIVLGTRPGVNAQLDSVIEMVKKLTTAYYLFGSAFTFVNEEALHMVEYAICPLSRSNEGALTACISEPLSAWAMFNFLSDYGKPVENLVLELMGQLSSFPTVCGLLIEKVLIPKIMTWLEKNGTFDKHPYFATFRSKLPKWFRGSKWRKTKTQGEATLGVSNRRHGRDLITWLQEYGTAAQESDTFMPENIATQDAASAGMSSHVDVFLALFQFKLWNNPITVPQLQRALRTTDYHFAYNNSEEKQDEAVDLMRKTFHADKGVLRILFYHPPPKDTVLESPALPASVVENGEGGTDVVLYLNKMSSPDVFGDDDESKMIWHFIHELAAER